MAETEYEFTDRYQGTGRAYPHGLTVCIGQCEGMGCYPVLDTDRDNTLHELQEISRIRSERGPEADGYYFIRCDECNGTGKCSKLETVRRIPRWIRKGIRFLWDTRKGGYYGEPHLDLRTRLLIALRS